MWPATGSRCADGRSGGPDTELAPPRVALAASVSESGRRRIMLSVESGLRGEMIGVHVSDGVDGELTGVGGVEWGRQPTPLRSLVHWGRPDPGNLLVGMTLAPLAAEVAILIVEHHLRPREPLGTYFFERPDSMFANAAAGSDRIIQRTLVRLSAIDSSGPPGLSG